jgi:hypothetical protein
MNARERFHETFRYGTPDRVFLMPQWVFGDTRNRWYNEGMPADEHFNAHFGFDRMEYIPISLNMFPNMQGKVIELGPGWNISEDEFGGITKHWTDREIGMSQHLRYPVRDREGWEKMKKRMNPDAVMRYPEYWDHLKRTYRDRDFPLGIQAGSFYGWIRNWVGMENLALWYYDCPDLVQEMTEFVTEFTLKVNERALNEIPDIDYANIWEDMAMKTGPLISPKLFREYMVEPIKRSTKLLNEAGIDIIMVDCDGNIDALLPLWLECKVNLMFPLEIAASCDMLAYREKYGRELLMMGGIDKRVMRDCCTKADVEHEVMSKVPELVKQGGYSPFVDHSVPPDVSYENFRYYIDLIHEICTF